MLLYHHPIDYKKGDKVKIVVGHKKGKMGTVVGDVFSGQGFTIQFDDGSVSDHHISTLAPEVYNKPISESVEINESRIDEMMFQNYTTKFKIGDKVKIVRGEKEHVGLYGTVVKKHSLGAQYTIKHPDGTTSIHHVSAFDPHVYKHTGRIDEMSFNLKIGDKVKIVRGKKEYVGRFGTVVKMQQRGGPYTVKHKDGTTSLHHVSDFDPRVFEHTEQIDERVAVIRKGEKGKEKYVVSNNGKETEYKTHGEAYSSAAKLTKTQRKQSLAKPKPAPAPEQKPVVKVALKKKKAAPTPKLSRHQEKIDTVIKALKLVR